VVRRRQAGFTLIEVLVAAFVASMVFGLLVSWMARNLAAVGRARAQQHALLLGEQRARDFDLELRQSGLVEPGVENGEVPDPDSDLGWEVTVEPIHLRLPADYDQDASPSPLFEPTSRQQPESADPPLHRVSVRVFRLDDPDTDLIAPFVLFGVVPGESPQTAGGGVANPDAAYDLNGDGQLDADELKLKNESLANQQDGAGGGGGGGGASQRNPRIRDDRAQDPMGRAR
jgi:prepilin-type N-terminal cleavage/methylation domain-containing protein